MSTEDEPLIEYLRQTTPIDARREVYASQQMLRRIDKKFADALLPQILRGHPENINGSLATLHRTILIEALQKLAAANAELIAMAEREYDQQVNLQTMAILHPEYETLAPWRLVQGASVDGTHSTKE